MKRRAIQVGCLLGALTLLGFLVAASGLVPIRASDGHWRITEWFLKFAMQRSAATHSLGLKVPPLEDRGLIVKGAGHYEFSCRSCHGAPGIAPSRVTQTMLPAPTDLKMAVQDSSPPKLFHIVKHGVKFTGMPAFSSQARDDEVWAVVAFLLTLPGLDDKGYRELINVDESSAAPAGTVADSEFVRANRSCVQCHGGAGHGRGGTIPRIAGQRAEYIRNSLAAYARGSRASGIMEPITAELDAGMIRRLAEHYAQLPAKADAEAKPPRADGMIERGRIIAHEGIRGRRVPACIECHDPGGRRANPTYPLLNGQSARYLALQLELFKEGRRGGSSSAHLMESVVAGLEPADMEAVSLYFATRQPTSPTANSFGQ
jgi:cytochrome c553